MNDPPIRDTTLSDTSLSVNTKVRSQAPIQTEDSKQTLQGTMGKEKELDGAEPLESLGVKEIGKEVELPKEVVRVGVSARPTAVQLPENVQKAGVKPLGDTPLESGKSVSLPLTDEEVVKGLHAGISDSFRWLAEWCRRRLELFKKVLKIKHARNIS